MVLMAGKEHPISKKAKLEVLNTASFFYPDSERIMGWEIVANGFQIVLSGDVPLIVKNNLAKNLAEFLEENNLSLSDSKFFISHPGGPKVLDALSEIVTNINSPFELSYQSLKELGNMSSVSVLDVLRRNFETKRLKSNEFGMMIAMGPAFASEINLIRVP
jgi:alkylresorcinol/alkylpyrone synthase